MVFFSDVSGLLTSDGGDMGMVGGWVKVISGEVSNGTVISGESPPMPYIPISFHFSPSIVELSIALAVENALNAFE